MAEEVEQDIDSPTNGADGDSVIHRGNDHDDEHESEEIVEETVNDTSPRHRTQAKSQGKTKTFNIPDAASP